MVRTIGLVLAGGLAGAAALCFWIPDRAGGFRAGDIEMTSAEPVARALREVAAELAADGGAVGDDPRRAFTLAQSSGAERELLAALERWAELDSRSALQAALELPDAGQRSAALERVGAAWARRDPRAALATAATLPFGARARYRARVTAAWADLDPAGFLAHAAVSGALDELVGGLRRLIASDPESVFEKTGGRPIPRGSPLHDLRAAAVRAMVERDSEATLARLETMPAGAGRDALLKAAGESLARVDPDFAIEWVTSLDPPVRTAEQGVVAAIAETDFDRAYELDVALDQPLFGPSGAAVSGALRDPRNAAAVAAGLLARNDQRAPALLSNLLSAWVMRDTAAAIDWMLAHQAGLDIAIAQSIADRLAGADIDAAMSYIERMPSSWRAAWIAQVAGVYAGRNAEAAVDWIADFRGQPGYEQAFAEIVMQAAASDPRFAARHVEALNPALQAEAASRVASAWLEQDPEAAARWASSLADPEIAATATGLLTLFWLQSAPRAAERWALNAPGGPARDEALGVLMRLSNIGDLDTTRYLDELSSNEKRNEAVRRAVERLSSQDADRAEALLEAVADDPELGPWARDRMQELDSAGR